MLSHQEGNIMSFIIVDSKMDSVLGCYTSISDMKKKNHHISNKDIANLNQNVIANLNQRVI